MSAENRQPSDVDRHVGQRIRLARQMKTMSQQALAAKLNISFQQLQKYESGRNRVSVGRLAELCRALGVDVGFFFQDLGAPVTTNANIQAVEGFMLTPLGVELAAAMADLEDPELRRSLLQLVHAVASGRDITSALKDHADEP